MKNILEEFYFGSIDPNTQYTGKSPRYEKAVRVVSENEEALTQLLEGEEKKLFLDFANAHAELNGGMAVDKYILGFTLGVRIMVDVFAAEDDLLKE